MTTAFSDSDHENNVVIRRSHLGIMIFVNNVLFETFIKQKTILKATPFGLEIVRLCIARDLIVKTRLNLKTIEVPLIGVTNIYCNKQGVVKNTSIPKSTP